MIPSSSEECIATLNSVIDYLFRDGYKKGSEPVKGTERLCPYLLQLVEGCLDCGLYEGSIWWDCMGQVIDALGDKFQVAKDKKSNSQPWFYSKLSELDISRLWLLQMLNNVADLHDTLQEVFTMGDITKAYYTDDSIATNEILQKEFLRVLFRLTDLKIHLETADLPQYEIRLKPFTPTTDNLTTLTPTSDNAMTPMLLPTPEGEQLKKKTVRRVKKAEKTSLKQFVDMEVQTLPIEDDGDDIKRVTEQELKQLSDREELLKEKTHKLEAAERELQRRERAAKDVEQELESLRVLDQSKLRDLITQLAQLQTKAIKAKGTNTSLPSDVIQKITDVVQAATRDTEIGEHKEVVPAIPQLHRATSTSLKGFSNVDLSSPERERGLESDKEGSTASSGVCIDVASIPTEASGSNAGELFLTGLQTNELLEVERDGQLAIQGFKCIGCSTEFKQYSLSILKKPRRCHYSGKLYCHKCHTNKEFYLPSKIVHRWDFKQYKICNAGRDYLRSLSNEPVLHIHALNPALYQKVPRLQKSREMRTRLNRALTVLREVVPDALMNDQHDYILSEPDVYTMNDLILLQGKEHQTYMSVLNSLHARLKNIAARKSQALEDEINAIMIC